ncbi:hypothetical protein LSH36_1055g00102 [Paralvinella palmiformis]|uniref:UDP-glucuronosyltransferase n=1 Tax=Paralvinella palmiformis TaxID=53620 RepID=A0AAD9MS06_9ANNE|nr:hypothetical protein LSH36_1055g00102 [Paralvinella palmiformis]
MGTLVHIGIIMFCCGLSRSARVLVFPLSHMSHIIYHAKIAQLLAEEGHTVDIILPTYTKIPELITETNIRILSYEVNSTLADLHKKVLSKVLIDYVMSRTSFERFVNFMKIFMERDPSWDEMKPNLLNDEYVRAQLETTHYDVAVVDKMALKAYTALNFSTKFPVILFGTLIYEWVIGVPSLPSFVPIFISTFDDKMSFLQRFLNTVAYTINYILLTVVLPDPPISVSKFPQLCSMYFVLDDVAVSYPRPTTPNIIFVGDAIPSPSKPLLPNIARFVESAERGVILVSFGTYISNLPYDLASKFCSAFERIPQKVIWKITNQTICGYPTDKVLALDWIPQNDLLGHPNVKLFISHCGKNSLLESIYHATPILAFPTAIDQPYNAQLVESRGLGHQMRLGEFSADDLASNITGILENRTILSKVQGASLLMRNKTDTPSKRISYWIEHMAAYGDTYLRSNAMDLNVLQFYCLDVLLAIMAIVALVITINVYLLKTLFRCFGSVSIRKMKVA